MRAAFIKNLYKWYDLNKRDHPWLGSHNAYLIWLSEVIMQQTRIEQGTSYFLKFAKRFPTINDLAKADETIVLKLWEGLGYYSRARNLLFTAKEIVSKYNSRFPETYDEIIKLKGIGNYTASAILSFAFQLPYAVIDANVLRILSRYFGIHEPIDSNEGRKQFDILAQKLIDKKDPGKYNQAIMDFGALVCTPVAPRCEDCPLQKNCWAFKNDAIQLLPVKIKKTAKRKRYFNYLVFTEGKSTLIEQRKAKDIWTGLFQFPLLETTNKLNSKQLTNLSGFKKICNGTEFKIHSVITIRQQLTHQLLDVNFYLIEIKDLSKIGDHNYQTVSRNGLKKFAFPGAIRDYLSEITTFRFHFLEKT